MKQFLSLFLLFTILHAHAQEDTTIYYDTQKEFNKSKPPKGYVESVRHELHWMVTFTRKLKGYEKKDTALKSIPTKVVLITYKEGFEEDVINFCTSKGGTIMDQFDGMLTCHLPKKVPIGKFIVDLKRLEYVIDAEQDIIKEEKYETIDPRYNEQWSLNNSTDKDIDAPESWQKFLRRTMAKSTLAIFDGSGVDFNHADLKGVFDYTFNAIDRTTNVGVVGNYEKHGTSCSMGLAISDNGIGIAGICYNYVDGAYCKMGYNSQSSGTFYTSQTGIVAGYYWAASVPGCRVISNSYGALSGNSSVQSAILYFIKNAGNGLGGLVFGSTGNSGAITWKNYPASYNGVIGVGASTSSGTRASFSNHGNGLDLSAPGLAVLSPDVSGTPGYNTTDYTSFSGTSAACPVAASVAASIFSYAPWLTAKQAYEVLIQSCEKTGGYSYADLASDSTSGTWSKELGYGVVNQNNACLIIDGLPLPGPTPPTPPVPPAPPVPPTPAPGIADLSADLEYFTYLTDSTAMVYYRYYNKGTAQISTVNVPKGFELKPSGWQARSLAPGAYTNLLGVKVTIPKGGGLYKQRVAGVNGVMGDANSSNDYDEIWIPRRN